MKIIVDDKIPYIQEKLRQLADEVVLFVAPLSVLLTCGMPMP